MAFVALHERVDGAPGRPAGANGIAWPAPGRDDRRDSGVAKSIVESADL